MPHDTMPESRRDDEELLNRRKRERTDEAFEVAGPIQDPRIGPRLIPVVVAVILVIVVIVLLFASPR
jgi:hypothetical protein